MIGQSGLPMMNNLAGSKEKAPEDVKTKTAANEAGVFEKILMPNEQAYAAASDPEILAGEKKELTRIKQGSPLVDAEQPGRLQFKTSRDGEAGTPPHAGSNNQILTAAPESRKAELLTAKPELPLAISNHSATFLPMQSEVSLGGPPPQTTEIRAKATKPEILSEITDRLDSLGDCQSGMADTSQTQTEIALPSAETRASGPSDQTAKPDVDVTEFASSRVDPGVQVTATDPKSPNAGLPIGERYRGLPQQTSLQPTASRRNPGSAPIAIKQSMGETNVDATVLKADGSETSVRLAANQLSELSGQQPQSQAEFIQDRSRPLISRLDMRSAGAWIGATSPSDPATTTPVSYASASEETGLKAMVPTLTLQAQTLAPETLFSTQGALSEQSDFLWGSSKAVTSTTSSRLDAPTSATAPLPASAEAKLIVQQINQAIVRMDGARTEIMLDPVELGRVSLTFITKDEGVTVLINADRSETADLLRRNGEQLHRDLSNAGYEDVELDFDQGEDAHPDPSAADRLDDLGASRSPSVSYEVNLATSGLDIRI